MGLKNLFGKKELIYPKTPVPYTDLTRQDYGNYYGGKRTRRIGFRVRCERWLEKYMRVISISIFLILIAVVTLLSIKP